MIEADLYHTACPKALGGVELDPVTNLQETGTYFNAGPK
jgi:hypothetical protein